MSGAEQTAAGDRVKKRGAWAVAFDFDEPRGGLPRHTEVLIGGDPSTCAISPSGLGLPTA